MNQSSTAQLSKDGVRHALAARWRVEALAGAERLVRAKCAHRMRDLTITLPVERDAIVVLYLACDVITHAESEECIRELQETLNRLTLEPGIIHRLSRAMMQLVERLCPA